MKKETLRVDDISPALGHWSTATKAGPFVFVSGLMPYDQRLGRVVQGFADLPPAVRSLATGRVVADSRQGPAAAQLWHVWDQAFRLLERFGSGRDDVLLVDCYTKDLQADFPVIARARKQIFAPRLYPTATISQIPAFGPAPQPRLTLDLLALVPEPGWEKEIVSAPQTYDHLSLTGYEMASRVGPYVFMGGLVAVKPEIELLVRSRADLAAIGWELPLELARLAAEREEVVVQAWFICESMRRAFAENGWQMSDLVKLQVYLTNMANRPIVERIVGTFLDEVPVVTVLEVESLAIPEFLLEIGGMAIVEGRDGRRPERRTIAGRHPAVAFEPAALAIQGGDLLFVSGLLGLDSRTGRFPHHYRDLGEAANELPRLGMSPDSRESAIASQTYLIYRNLAETLAAAGSALENVLKLTVYLRDFRDFPAWERVTQQLFPKDPPAVMVVQAGALPAPDAVVEIDAIALAQSR